MLLSGGNAAGGRRVCDMTLVSHDHRFIFLKTRKTAGSSIEGYLMPWCLPPGVTLPQTEFRVSRHGAVGAITGPKKRLRAETPWWRPIWYHHMPAAEVRRRIGRRKFDSYVKISSVRNPFDRMVSSFHFRMSERGETFDGFDAMRQRFRRFVLDRNWENDLDIVTLDGRFIVEQMIRFENLVDDLATVCAKLGLPFDRERLPHEKNMSASRKSYPVADYYDSETIARVRERLAWVFDNFDYPDHPAAAVSQMNREG